MPTAPPHQMEKMQGPVRAARTLYLFGNGDGKRITGVPQLAKAAGIHENTVRRWIKTWEKENEEIVSSGSSQGLALSLRAEEVALHHKDMHHLRQDIEAIKWEMENLDSIIAKLEGICDNFALNTDNGDAALAIFEAYLRASTNKSNLRRQFLAAQKQWTDLSGIRDLKDIQATAAKELEKGRVKIKLKAEGVDAPRDVTPAGSAAAQLREV